MNTRVKYSIIVPVYNEELVIRETYRRLKEVMGRTGESYELLFVNDGSTDLTADIIQRICDWDETVKLINFSRNFGHQIAITAGMDYSAGDAVVVIDADLQDLPELILDMIQKWKDGYDVVYARRIERKGETWFKKQTARMFYRVLQLFTEIDIPLDTGDFRLMDRKVCNEMKRLTEKNRFVRGMVSWVGFRQTAVEYVREEPAAGETKYPLKKMIQLSLDGLTSFSLKPLKLAAYGGGILAVAGAIDLLVIALTNLAGAGPVSGWHLMVSTQLLIGGSILAALGIFGEYIGRIYDETRDRPLYIVKDCYGTRKKASGRKGVI